jgi:hypothetical protein
MSRPPLRPWGIPPTHVNRFSGGHLPRAMRPTCLTNTTRMWAMILKHFARSDLHGRCGRHHTQGCRAGDVDIFHILKSSVANDRTRVTAFDPKQIFASRDRLQQRCDQAVPPATRCQPDSRPTTKERSNAEIIDTTVAYGCTRTQCRDFSWACPNFACARPESGNRLHRHSFRHEAQKNDGSSFETERRGAFPAWLS